jgi:hypothetical protein
MTVRARSADNTTLESVPMDLDDPALTALVSRLISVARRFSAHPEVGCEEEILPISAGSPNFELPYCHKTQ